LGVSFSLPKLPGMKLRQASSSMTPIWVWVRIALLLFTVRRSLTNKILPHRLVCLREHPTRVVGRRPLRGGSPRLGRNDQERSGFRPRRSEREGREIRPRSRHCERRVLFLRAVAGGPREATVRNSITSGDGKARQGRKNAVGQETCPDLEGDARLGRVPCRTLFARRSGKPVPALGERARGFYLVTPKNST